MKRQKYAIKDVEKLIGVSRQTLYGWEKAGKVPKGKRDPMSNYRYWTEADIKTLKKIMGRD